MCYNRDKASQLGEFKQASIRLGEFEQDSNTDSAGKQHRLAELAKPVEMPCLCCNTDSQDSNTDSDGSSCGHHCQLVGRDPAARIHESLRSLT